MGSRHADMLAEATDALAAGEPAILCTVVRLQGSGYGRPGARLLLLGDGRRLGFVSGGCLERELSQLAWPATQDGPATLTFDTRGNPTQPGGRYNAGCDGCTHILCERVSEAAIAPLRALVDAIDPILSGVVYDAGDSGLPVGLRRTGDDPGELAAAFGVAASGALGGHYSLELTDPPAAGASVFVERLQSPPAVVLFGAGDDVVPVASLAAAAGRRVAVVASQPDRLAADRWPAVVRIESPAATAVQTLDRQGWLAPRTACVLMTHSFDDDLTLLPGLLASPANYVGMLGPKRRMGRLMTRLHERGRLPAESQLEKLRSPVGLDLGATTPEEIALAIVAEIVAAGHGRTGGSLARRDGAIHEPHRHLTADPVLT